MSRPQAAPRAHTAAERWFQWTEPVDPVTQRHAVAAPVTGSHRATTPAIERRRRAQHFARRRRDLLVDAVLALILAIILISLTAGLGILLLVVVPMAGGLIAHRVIQRRRARRHAAPARPYRSSPRARPRPRRH